MSRRPARARVESPQTTEEAKEDVATRALRAVERLPKEKIVSRLRRLHPMD